ncbi:MAG TPA: DUF1028 domain-containing protein [Gemmatimonadales bacterium]|nr:DUF1028 domain-containing protein [Gemmatimonadales bacterium]
MRSLLADAIALAAQAHRGQVDKAGEPYILQPIGVLLRIREQGHRVEVQAAAVLHDVVEDTKVTLEDVAALSPEDLEERLLRTIEAGRDAGGQHGGQQSAALLVYDNRPFAHVDLRVDVHTEPIGELRRVFDVYRPAIPYYNLRQVDARVPPLHDWLAARAR